MWTIYDSMQKHSTQVSNFGCGIPALNYNCFRWSNVSASYKDPLLILGLDYEPLELLGRGISSVVRRCLHRESGKPFAVKIIDLLQEEAPTIEEVQNEARAFKLVNHDYSRNALQIDLLHELAGSRFVIDLFDVYQTETYVFLVFELMKECARNRSSLSLRLPLVKYSKSYYRICERWLSVNFSST